MNFTISGHHLELTPAIRAHVLAKLERIQRHFGQLMDVSVIVSMDNTAEKERRQKAEITLRVKGKDLHAASSAPDLYAAIDVLIDKLDRQVIKYKSKVQNHQHEPVKRQADDIAAEGTVSEDEFEVQSA